MSSGNPTSFDDLLYKAEQLTAEMDQDDEMPRIERNLKQLSEAGQELWTRTASQREKDKTDVRASVLLGTKGYDLQKVSQELDSLNAAKKMSTVEGIKDTDIQSFLRNERENAILSVIQEVKTSAYECVEKQYWNNLKSEWEDYKVKMLNALVGPNRDLSEMDLSIDASQKSTTSEKYTMKHKSFYETTHQLNKTATSMTNTETEYAKETVKYVEHLVEGGVKYHVADNFLKSVAHECVGEQIIIDLWEHVVPVTKLGATGQIRSDPLSYRLSHLFQVKLIRQSLTILEKKHREFMEATVFGEPKEGPGSANASYNLVKNFLNSKVPTWLNLSSTMNQLNTSQNIHNTEDGLVDGHPVWCFIWNCLRAGLIDAAIELLHRCSTISPEFVNYIREYGQNQHRLSPKSENEIRIIYKRSIRLCTDPFKKAVYSILGCCDVSEEHRDVVEKVEDLIWMKLCQLKIEEVEVGDTAIPTAKENGDKITLAKLQAQINEQFGVSYFDASQQPFTYFKLLFLTGQFEAAIEFLSRIDSYRAHAIHVAIALNESDLLILPKQHLNVPLLSKQSNDPNPIKRLNFARLLMIYTRKFEASNPIEAIYYFYLLRDMKSGIEDNIFISSVSRVVRETKEFNSLLGYINEDGCRIGGVLDKFQGDVESIINQVALDCENAGMFEEAIRLYDLISDHNKTLSLLNKNLSPLVSERKTSGSKRDRLENIAVSLGHRYYFLNKCLNLTLNNYRYCNHGHNAQQDIAGTFYLLLDLMTFFDYYHNQSINDALDVNNYFYFII